MNQRGTSHKEEAISRNEFGRRPGANISSRKEQQLVPSNASLRQTAVAMVMRDFLYIIEDRYSI
jgi:hypothetical protein